MSNGELKSSELSISIQKKLLGKMVTNRCVVKKLIDETTGHLLDNLHRIIKTYRTETSLKQTKDSDKVVKNLIKVILKIAILLMNEQFNATEHRLAESLSKQLRCTLMVMISFHEVDYSYDRMYLTKSLENVRQTLKDLVRRSLSDKSQRRIDNVFDMLTNADFLDVVFQAKPSTNSNAAHYLNIRSEMVCDLSILLEKL